MPGMAVGDAAARLPWLCPQTESLIALAESPARLPALAARDPGLAVFLLRFISPPPAPDGRIFLSAALESPVLPATAAAFLTGPSVGVLSVSSLIVSRLLRIAARAATLAEACAQHTRRCHPAVAALLARLVPLGWYAVAAVDPVRAAEPLADPEYPGRETELQHQLWGATAAEIAHRLCYHWGLPDWVCDVIGNGALPFRVARTLTTQVDLLAVVRWAVREAETGPGRLGLLPHDDQGDLLDYLGIGPDVSVPFVARDGSEVASEDRRGRTYPTNPYELVLLPHLLRVTAEARQRSGRAALLRWEQRCRRLLQALTEQEQLFQKRAHETRLAALAELAAGAGHEINNPLAVISGQAQRLLRTEADPERGERLRMIVRQADRIADLLRDLMRFARPPKPRPDRLAVDDLLRSVRDRLATFAHERGVRLEIPPAEPDVFLVADREQVGGALAAVVRNGIEAAGPLPDPSRDHCPTATTSPAWVRLSCQISESDRVEIVVEDSGGGLAPDVAEHAFDPFYCGRTAGRGRGLGLPTAWRLLRQNGGDLRYDPTPHSPARFVLTLPRAAPADERIRRSA